MFHDYYFGGDGIQNDNAGGFGGLTVSMVGGGALPVTTASDGSYLFTRVDQLNEDGILIAFRVQFTKPADTFGGSGGYSSRTEYRFAPADAPLPPGDNRVQDEVDSDADSTGLTGEFVLHYSGQVVRSIDCGIQQRISSGYGGPYASYALDDRGAPDAVGGPGLNN